MKRFLSVILVLMLVIFAAQAQAVSVNWTGGGDNFAFSSLDWSQSSALADGTFPMANAPATSPMTLYTHGSLANFTNAQGNTVQGTGLHNNYEITFVTGFGEVGGQSVNPFGVGSTTLFFDPNNQVNFFRMYYDTAKDANALAGTGFNNGALILSGTVVDSFGFFAVISPTPEVLDQFGSNDWAGVGTLRGIGSSTAAVTIDSYDSNYLDAATLQSILISLLYNTNQTTPFTETDPSRLFTNMANLASIAPNFGGENTNGFNFVNGRASNLGNNPTDFLMQVDATTSFTTSAVPEPASLVLLGAGLLGLGVVVRGRKKV